MKIRSILSYLLLRCFPWLSKALFVLYRRFALLTVAKSASSKEAQKISGGVTSTNFDPSSKLLIVVPSERFHQASWTAGGGNYFYEIYESALENLSISKIDYFVFTDRDPIYDGFRNLADLLVDGEYTHCLALTESDPNCATSWNWDYFARILHRSWNGMFIGLATDSVYLLQQLRFSQFNKIYGRSLLIGIDVKPQYLYLSGSNYFGPVFLPISNKSINSIDEELSNYVSSEKQHDVVFSGKMYPYRIEALEELSFLNLNLGVNPHLNIDDDESEPTYIQYIRSLRLGRFALNLARAGGINKKQLKSRVLEAGLFGVPVLSDESELSGIFFELNQHFLSLTISEDSHHLSNFLQDNTAYERLVKDAQLKARSLAPSSFWKVVSESCLAYALNEK